MQGHTHRDFHPPVPAVTRALTGHRSNVKCLDFSIYGLLSGSMDTNVKAGVELLKRTSCTVGDTAGNNVWVMLALAAVGPEEERCCDNLQGPQVCGYPCQVEP